MCWPHALPKGFGVSYGPKDPRALFCVPLPSQVFGASLSVYQLSIRFIKSTVLRRTPPTIADVARESWSANVVVGPM
ncbi:hypothetical protein BHE74_00001170, partial [Ensete ventricosum]